MQMRSLRLLGWLLLGSLAALGCGSDVDDLGVGAACSLEDDCDADVSPALVCLSEFKGGYCGMSGCKSNADCPAESACVVHSNGTNYCFRTCTDKAQCNVNRTPDAESNCSSSVEFADGKLDLKACVPPSK